MCLKLLEYYLEGDDCIIFEGNVHEYIIFVNFCFDQLYRSQLLVYALFFFFLVFHYFDTVKSFLNHYNNSYN